MNGYGEERLAEINKLKAEMDMWVRGERSHMNVISCISPDDPAKVQVMVAQADAAEVQKLSAAIVAHAALAESLGWAL